jgi:hypothetical protein
MPIDRGIELPSYDLPFSPADVQYASQMVKTF